MKARQPESVPSNEVIKQMQESLLRAVLTRRGLSPDEAPVEFPDLSFVERQPAIFLVDENLAGPISIEGLSKPIHLLSRDKLQEEARSGDLTYFYFHPPFGRHTGARRAEVTDDDY